jgi:hypothetical protein
LAHAAVFLIRLSKSSEAILVASRVETAILDHHIKSALEVLHTFDLSETGLGRYLAKRVRVAREKLSNMAETQPHTIVETCSTIGIHDFNRGNPGLTSQDQGQGGDPLNFEAFFQEQSGYDISRLLDPFTTQGMNECFPGMGWSESNTIVFPPPTDPGLDYAAIFD